ncbi:peptidase dimerization domain-containing protein [Salinicoccus sp. CNSTN-B1]
MTANIPLDNAVVTVGKIRAGDAFNVIPDTAELVGTVRTFEQSIKERIKDIFQKEVDYTARKRGRPLNLSIISAILQSLTITGKQRSSKKPQLP